MRNSELRGGDFVATFARTAGLCLLLQFAIVNGAHAQNVRTIFFVRHAEKVSDDIDAALSATGRRRAACLADTLADARIDQIFVSGLQRTQQTAAPLASKLKAKPVAVPLSTPELLVEAIRSSTAANLLVVWHDQTLPKIMQALGAPPITPIGHTEYDRLFILTLKDDKFDQQPRFTAPRYCNPAK